MVNASNLAERVAQRLCHDFAGPIGAIVTAVDLLGDESDPEINALIGDSARTLSASLRLHRLVYGPAGGDLQAGEARALLSAWAATRADLGIDWAIADEQLTAARAGLLLGLAMLAGESAPRGGVVRVEPSMVTLTASQLRFDPPVAAALEDGGAEAAPATALACLLARRAAALGGALKTRTTADALQLIIQQPAGRS